MLAKPGIALYCFDNFVNTSCVSFGTYTGMFGARSVLTQTYNNTFSFSQAWIGHRKQITPLGWGGFSIGGERGNVTHLSVS